MVKILMSALEMCSDQTKANSKAKISFMFDVECLIFSLPLGVNEPLGCVHTNIDQD